MRRQQPLPKKLATAGLIIGGLLVLAQAFRPAPPRLEQPAESFSFEVAPADQDRFVAFMAEFADVHALHPVAASTDGRFELSNGSGLVVIGQRESRKVTVDFYCEWGQTIGPSLHSYADRFEDSLSLVGIEAAKTRRSACANLRIIDARWPGESAATGAYAGRQSP